MRSRTTKIVPNANLTDFFRERVQEVIAEQQVAASSMLEFYLVNLLQEFRKTEKLFETQGTQVVEKPLALLLAQAMEGDLNTRIRCLKRLGDTALYISGFFSESIDRKLVDRNYYIGMGGGAYQSLSHILNAQKTFAELYLELGKKFSEWVEVVAAIANQAPQATNTDLLRVYERWLASGNEQLANVLREAGIILDPEGKVQKPQ